MYPRDLQACASSTAEIADAWGYGVYVGAGNPNSGPHDCTDLSSQAPYVFR